MKRVIVVSKTHLDLGFTDYAENIKNKYLNEFIPDAITLAESVNNDKRNFVWTTGSWLLNEALDNGTAEGKRLLYNAIKKGYIAPHAMPFTLHTELLDEDTLDFGLSLVDRIDEIKQCKTISAKMTDVPGHTISLVPLLYKHGIRLLHIGVNGASAIPEIPECFLWKYGDSEVVVIYSGEYGGEYKNQYVDDILYFDHTLDNHGASGTAAIIENINKISSKYPDYEVTAGTLDEYAEKIWAVRDKLPVVTDEIGDTWIHGSASDPYKSGALRCLIEHKNKWLSDGSLTRDSAEYSSLCTYILCLAEHTCGMDSKMYLADFESYLKGDFVAARGNNISVQKNPELKYNKLASAERERGNYKQGSYQTIEASWAEQREYINKALSVLNTNHRTEISKSLSALRPTDSRSLDNPTEKREFEFSRWRIAFNEFGGIKSLTDNGANVINDNLSPLLEYRLYSDKDYDFWLNHYTRDYDKNYMWSTADFLRPHLDLCADKYKSGHYFYKMDKASVSNADDELSVTVNLVCDKSLCDDFGAPRLVQVTYHLRNDSLRVSVDWYSKDASRLTEAIFLHLVPSCKRLMLSKLNNMIDPVTVVSKGNRSIHASQYATLDIGEGSYKLINHHSPLLTLGKGKILEFDNAIESTEQYGISYILYNNVWGTNFPLWYEDNAHFDFTLL